MSGIGGIKGQLKLIVGDAEVDLGTVHLPLEVTRVCKERESRMSFGLGVDLERVAETIKAVFAKAEGER